MEPTQYIGVVSKAEDEIDFVTVGKDQHIYTGHWNPHDGWLGPWWLNGGLAPAGTPVEIVSRKHGVLDLFVSAGWSHTQELNKNTYGAHWEPGHEGWCGWSLTTKKGAACYDGGSERYDL
ncbi:hypothetical protein BJ508DRAFT_328303 [Ascobolus immersus RN42]|uniref:Fucose-specific lectin n=1 Tax=Ascobolus immersus RN42 TaxID=1160509 RepID=A0A3N4HZX5_ASCIM|nr:hypothetical protein BJ508DRAFT_328303 [Ascobolus immersus RN42]